VEHLIIRKQRYKPQKMNPEVTSPKSRHAGRDGLFRWLSGIAMLSGNNCSLFSQDHVVWQDREDDGKSEV
jgi:hypothetical protein